MNRKRIWCAAAVLAVLCVPVRAQDWQSALKSVASNVADKATGGALTQLALVATWNYMQPGVKLESDNAVADLAASATTASLQSKLAGIYEKAGLGREGFHYYSPINLAHTNAPQIIFKLGRINSRDDIIYNGRAMTKGQRSNREDRIIRKKSSQFNLITRR